MTREEAKRRLLDIERCTPIHTREDARDFEALEMAIQALSQEPKFLAKSDGTIEQIKDCEDCLFKKEWEKIGKLISVVLEKQTEQEPKTGHWIYTGDYITDGMLKCSQCGFEHDVSERFLYCPNCGCRMVEPQESEEQG